MCFIKNNIIFLWVLFLTACIAVNPSGLVKEEIKNRIYIYNGPGVSLESLQHTQYSLKSLTQNAYTVELIEPQEVSTGEWRKDAKLFVMPGGADMPYCKYLHPMGNRQIKEFIKDDGGAYLGFCAGAYYGSHKVEFAQGTDLEVVGTRDLDFFLGISKGPVLAPYDYKSNSGARVAVLRLNDSNKSADQSSLFSCYYNGGGYFVNPQKYPDTTVLAYYVQSNKQEEKAAIIEIKVGKGLVILSGPHCEYAPELLNKKDIYLSHFISKLEDSNASRIKFLSSLIKRLGINR